MAGRGTGLDIVVDNVDFLESLGEVLFPDGGVSFCFDFCFALAVGGFGLLEDADKVLALLVVSGGVSYRRGSLSATYAAHHLARLVDDSDGLADSHCEEWCRCRCTARRRGVTRESGAV